LRPVAAETFSKAIASGALATEVIGGARRDRLHALQRLAGRSFAHPAVARRVLLPTAVAVLVLVAWEYGLRLTHVSPIIIAPPSAIWEVLENNPGILLRQSMPTIASALVGFGLAAALGIFLGAALVLSSAARKAFYPYILILQLIPKVALAPLFIVWLGVGPTSRLSFAVFMAFFPVVIATMTGLMSADRNAVRLADSLTASPWQIFRSVRIPYALPHIFAGLKISATMAMIGVIVGEFVTAQEGLGYLVMFATSAAETALTFAAIALLCVIGLALYGGVVLVEAVVQRWQGVTITTSEF
jgi:NitT/TauT family transport system permease protein